MADNDITDDKLDAQIEIVDPYPEIEWHNLGAIYIPKAPNLHVRLIGDPDSGEVFNLIIFLGQSSADLKLISDPVGDVWMYYKNAALNDVNQKIFEPDLSPGSKDRKLSFRTAEALFVGFPKGKFLMLATVNGAAQSDQGEVIFDVIEQIATHDDLPDFEPAQVVPLTAPYSLRRQLLDIVEEKREPKKKMRAVFVNGELRLTDS